MEGLPYEQRHIDTIRKILDGQYSLKDYLREMKEKYGEA